MTRKKFFTWATVAFLGFSSLGCGYILYPQRRNANARGGQLDVAVVIMDVLWLIPGILPGVFALVWDGIHGSWYVSGSESPMLGQNPQPVPHLSAQRPFEIRNSAAEMPRLHLRDAAGRIHTLPVVSLAHGRTVVAMPAQAAKGSATILVEQGQNTRTIPVVID